MVTTRKRAAQLEPISTVPVIRKSMATRSGSKGHIKNTDSGNIGDVVTAKISRKKSKTIKASSEMIIDSQKATTSEAANDLLNMKDECRSTETEEKEVHCSKEAIKENDIDDNSIRSIYDLSQKEIDFNYTIEKVISSSNNNSQVATTETEAIEVSHKMGASESNTEKTEDTQVYMDTIVLRRTEYQTCELCNRQFNSIQAIKCHYKQKHPTEAYNGPEKVVTNKDIQCDICLDKFTEMAYLKSHYKMKHKKKLIVDSFQCAECQFTCNSKRDFQKHMEANHMASFKCNYCSNSYSSLRSLNNHMRTHSEHFNSYVECAPHMIVTNHENKTVPSDIPNPNTIPNNTNVRSNSNNRFILNRLSKREKHKKIVVRLVHTFIQTATSENIDKMYDDLLLAITKLTKNLRIYHGINHSDNYYIRKRKIEKSNESIDNSNKNEGEIKENIVVRKENGETSDIVNPITGTEGYIEEFIQQIRNKTTLTKDKNPRSSNSKFINKDLMNQFFKNPRNCYRLITSEETQEKIISTTEEVQQH